MSKRARRADALLTLLGIAVGLCLSFPIFYGILGAFKTPAEFTAYPPSVLPNSFAYLDNFRAALTKLPIFRLMGNSLIVAALGAGVRVLLATLAAYAFAFFTFRGKKLLFFLLLGTMMFPADTLIVTNYLTVTRLGLVDTYLGICITSFVGASTMFMLRQHFRALPKALREAAVIDGCGDLRFMASVLLPISRAILLTVFVQSFVAQWNAYLWPLLVTNRTEMRTMQIGIAMLTTVEGTNYEQVLAGVALSMIPAFVLFLILRRSIVHRVTAGAIVG
ncbi:MAG: carbohydrate ABC transporter permease [Oscillospiraceae bacterium]|jgi:sn-glycerol 3-phosphate transport system permease protein|nr:carbohydrate ABC transporter permease [Oscillospiraceae bacterium]